MNRTGIILLAWIVATTDAGIYSLAFNIAFVVQVPRTAVNTLFAPTISGLYARNDKAMMQVLVTRVASWTLCAGICIALALFILAEPLLAWFGPGYEAGVPALRILLISQVIAAGGGSQLYVMTMTAHERSAAVLLIPSLSPMLSRAPCLSARLGWPVQQSAQQQLSSSGMRRWRSFYGDA